MAHIISYFYKKVNQSIYFIFSIYMLYLPQGDNMNALEINVLVLAYLGDTVYENYIRRFLIKQSISNVNDLQTKSIEYVSAKKQFIFIKDLIDDNFFTEEELSVIKRARNYKSSSHPKNCDI